MCFIFISDSIPNLRHDITVKLLKVASNTINQSSFLNNRRSFRLEFIIREIQNILLKTDERPVM